MAETIATRAAYGESLVALAEQDPALLVLDADLSSATMTKNFSKAYPDRFFNMGIAECNMIGVAAGLAACGKKPFANTFAMVLSFSSKFNISNSAPTKSILEGNKNKFSMSVFKIASFGSNPSTRHS